MKKTLFSIAGLIVALTAFSQTDVNGTITTNTNWSLSGSPYNITGDVQIPSGVSLSIAPGVKVDFKGTYQVLVSGGVISAQGTDLLPITFSGNAAGKAMLLFKSADLSQSSLVHTVFTGPQEAIQLADESDGAEDAVKNQKQLLVNFSTISNTTLTTKGIGTISSLHVLNSILNSVTLKTINQSSDSLIVENSDLKACTVDSKTMSAEIALKHCTITTSSFAAERMTSVNSTFTSSAFSESPSFVQSLHISNCEFKNSTMNIPKTQLFMDNSIFEYTAPVGMRLGLGSIYCSRISGNNQGTALSLVSWTDITIVGTFNFKNNTFSQNKIAIEMASDLPSSLNGIDSNNFINNSIYHIKNLGKAMGGYYGTNYWDASDSATIAQKIFDYADDPNLGRIKFTPFLTAPYYSKVCAQITLSTPDLDHKNQSFDIELYPNPASSSVTLKMENLTKLSNTATIDVIDLTGKTIHSQPFNTAAGTETINVSGFSKGIYFCKIISGSETVVKKLVIQ